jgi:hypothetical protein
LISRISWVLFSWVYLPVLIAENLSYFTYIYYLLKAKYNIVWLNIFACHIFTKCKNTISLMNLINCE